MVLLHCAVNYRFLPPVTRSPFLAPRTAVARAAVVLVSLAILSTLSPASDTPFGLWEPVADLPAGLAGVARGVVGGKLLVAGGTAWVDGVKQLPETVWAYDPDSGRWAESGRLPRAFAFGISAACESALTMLGGDDGSQTHASGLVLAADGTSRPAPGLPRSVAYAGFAQAANGTLFDLGGTPTMQDLANTHASFFRFNPADGHTDILPDYPRGPVIHAALTVAAGCVYVFPGGLRHGKDETTRNSQAAWRYVLVSGQWESIAPYPVPIRGLAAGALDGRFILLAGGLQSTPDGRNEITGGCHLNDIRSDTYLALPALPHPAMLLGLEVLAAHVYAFGGEDGLRHRSAHMFRAAISRLTHLGSEDLLAKATRDAHAFQTRQGPESPDVFTRKPAPRRGARGRSRWWR